MQSLKIYRPAGLSQEQLAVRLQLDGLGLTQKAISRMETGERVVADYELVHLARALEVVFWSWA